MEFMDLFASKRPQTPATKPKRKGQEEGGKPEAKKSKPHSLPATISAHPRFVFAQLGKPVYRLGNDKFVYVGPSTDGKISTIHVVFGEWKEQPNNSWKASYGKNVSLSKIGFLRLAALMLTEKADMDETARASAAETGRLTPLYLLDRNMYFGWSRFNGTNVATIRRFEVKGGDMIPTRYGVSFGERYYDGLKDLMKDLQLFKDMVKIQNEQGVHEPVKEGLEYPMLCENVAEALAPLVKQLDDGTINQCHEENYRPSDGEWNGAVERFLELRMVHGILFGLDKLSVEQALDLDVAGFLKKHEDQLRENGDPVLTFLVSWVRIHHTRSWKRCQARWNLIAGVDPTKYRSGGQWSTAGMSWSQVKTENGIAVVILGPVKR
ncbi:uncharacterized protein LOC129586021 [Paramacrobiotus metropolitanus]|uniref:uncharacterized protein LOC129586021 n=1 Tax=Paramacrobiotus metropolitanus TaxID=2943436 RepID=UPI0024458832|nr:uncharacterized protein LOC129586021 [Paramacrobiotus metropolitanus]